ncbi:serine/threonine-protein kinase Ypk3p [[Candida] anglica]|uniref:Serine/threonine-protein kinase Ypk3p n=1 Tax=[Candida] anglica TaxID=148631 RepID=A0ABP0EHQ7_9ASCO
MLDIFAMDGDLPPDTRTEPEVPGSPVLNYRVVEDPWEDVPEHDPDHDDHHSDLHDHFHDENETLMDLPKGLPIKQTRRNSVATSNPNSVDVDVLSRSFVSESLGGATYRPRAADFEPIKVLGRGSYGKVLLVRERATGRLFAQKQMKKISLLKTDDTSTTETPGNNNNNPEVNHLAPEVSKVQYQRTLNEKSILALVSHPNIVKLYCAFQDNNKVYLILEYLSGGELFSHLSQLNYLNETHASYYIAQTVLALRYLHGTLQVIYRDLKPENCMLNASGNLVLTDFGLSKVSESENKSMIGTPQYMAPEVLRGDSYNYLVDWWSLGCVAFDMLTGSPPFTGNNNKKVMDKIIHSKKYLKYPYYLSNDAKDFLRRLLQSNPAKRWDLDNDFEAVKKHRFFRHVDWASLERLDEDGDSSTALPPILPLITDPVLAENFDDEFTNMAITPPSTSGKDILHVMGFSYTNDVYMERLTS